MKHTPLSDVQPLEFSPIAVKPAELRRRRLERFADLLDAHTGPIRLFSQIETVPGRRRRVMRRDCSPFSIALTDPVFRVEGLANDTIGEASAFFGLSSWEAHELVCDCHYFGPVNGRTVAERARFIAAHPSIVSRVRNFIAGLTH